MKAKLISLYFLALGIFVLSSCNSDETTEMSKGDKMSFDVADISRASTPTALDRFLLYGDMKMVGHNDPLIIFCDTEVYKEGDRWKYKGEQYWYPRHEHSFVAVYPISAVNNPQYANSELTFSYAAPLVDDSNNLDYQNIDDILAATHRRIYSEVSQSNTTTFKFSHILTKINILSTYEANLMSADAYVEFTGIRLSGVKSEATFHIIPAQILSNNRTDDFVVNTDNQATDCFIKIDIPEPVKVYNNHTPVNLFADLDDIIMVPQTFGPDSDATITLTYTLKDDPTIREVDIPLKSQVWESGKSFNYQVTMTKAGLRIESTSISDWDAFDVDDIEAH